MLMASIQSSTILDWARLVREPGSRCDLLAQGVVRPSCAPNSLKCALYVMAWVTMTVMGGPANSDREMAPWL